MDSGKNIIPPSPNRQNIQRRQLITPQLQKRKKKLPSIPSSERHNSSKAKDQPPQECLNCKGLQIKLQAAYQQLQTMPKGQIEMQIASQWVQSIKTLKDQIQNNFQSQPPEQTRKNMKIKIIEVFTPETIQKRMDQEIKELNNIIQSNSSCYSTGEHMNFRSHQSNGENMNQTILFEKLANLNSELQRQLECIINTKRQNVFELKSLKTLQSTLTSLANEFPQFEIDTLGNPQKPSIIRVGGFNVQQFLLNTHKVYSGYLNQNQDANIKAQLYKAETCLVKNIFENKMPQPYKAIFSGQIKCPMCQELLNEEEQLVYLPCHIYHENCFITEAQKQLTQKQQFFVCKLDKKIIDTSIFLSLENQQAGYQICSEYLQNHQ